MSNESSLISKVWNFANILRDDDVGYGDYLEQITYLLFLKMADEMSKPPYNKKSNFRASKTPTATKSQMAKSATGRHSPITNAAQNSKVITCKCCDR